MLVLNGKNQKSYVGMIIFKEDEKHFAPLLIMVYSHRHLSMKVLT